MECIQTVTQGAHKDLSLISLIPKWTGFERTVSLEEFLAGIDEAAKIRHWSSADQLQIAVLEIQDPEKSCYNTCLELHAEGKTWEQFKSVFRERFKDVTTDQYHFTRVQTARQGKNKGPQEFADSCRASAQEFMCKANDPLAQQIHRENTDRMLLACFVCFDWSSVS
jgi:hypothetical protein